MTESRSVVAWGPCCKGARGVFWRGGKCSPLLTGVGVTRAVTVIKTHQIVYLKTGAFCRMQIILQLGYFLEMAIYCSLYWHVPSQCPVPQLPPSPSWSLDFLLIKTFSPWLHPPSQPSFLPQAGATTSSPHEPLHHHTLKFPVLGPWLPFLLTMCPGPISILFTVSTFHFWATEECLRES